MKKAQQIRTELKNIGITSKQVSVTSKNSINVRIKDLSINLETVKEIAQKYESYSRCEASGEILCGGNTFVFVSYDHDAERAAKEVEQYKEFLKLAEEAISKLEGFTGEEIVPGFVLFKTGNGNGKFQATVKWTEGIWNHYYSADEVALELYKAKLQGKF